MWKIECGDVLQVLKGYPDNHFDGVLSDPPYGYKFMNSKWDYDVPKKELWQEVLRVIKPGSSILVYGGTRTFHRLVCEIEDAGFEIRDTISWIYGSGFPKSYNISKGIDKYFGKEGVQGDLRTDGRGKWDIKMQRTQGDTGVGHFDGSKQKYHETLPESNEAQQWEGYGTALKPASEFICYAMKPVEENYVSNALKHGVAGLNIDDSRIGLNKNVPASPSKTKGNSLSGSKDGSLRNETGDESGHNPNIGRWPSNVILSHHPDCEQKDEQWNCVDACPVRMLDERGKEMNVHPAGNKGLSKVSIHANVYGKRNPLIQNPDYYGDGKSASPARFFYCAKVSSSERNAGLHSNFQEKYMAEIDKQRGKTTMENICPVHKKNNCECGWKPNPKNNHPTVKPIDLNKYLAKLIKPPKRKEPKRLLIPFSGSGSEMIGALLVDWDEITGIEQDQNYCNIAEARLQHWCGKKQLTLF